jgi:pSer/pThr/pTyr-binding forkhead associated (FHA) protein
MALTVLVRSGDARKPPAITFDAPRIVIGRGDGCDVRLPDASVSLRHASIRQRGTDYIVVDEGSTNGTFVGPVRLSPQAPRVLRSGDLVRVGRVWLELLIQQKPASVNPQLLTRELALELVAAALAAQGEAATARLVVEEPETGAELVLSEFERHYVLGRGKGADLSLEDDDASRRHADVTRRGAQIQVRDLGSKNGTKLGDRPLPPNKSETWSPGVPLVIGKHRIRLEDPVSDALRELDRAADEPMRADESVDPPGVESVVAPVPEAAAPGPAAPVASVPRAPGQTPRRSTRQGWSTTDLAVALMAVLVLGLSVLGLVWLFRLD